MRHRTRALRAVLAACLLAGSAGLGVAHVGSARAAGAPAVDPGPTPKAQCGPGSRPETTQGRTPAADFANGRAAQGYTCNLELIGRQGATGGFRVYHYVDTAGHECGFYDTAVIFPINVFLQPPAKTPGVFVLDMSDPRHPVQTDTLSTPAMLSPHESLSLNVKRGLLVADMGTALTYPGFVDIYDVSKDCRHPVLESSTPLGILGHEGTFSPDGNTFWVSSTGGQTITALDITNPSLPIPLWLGVQWVAHGMNVSDDGNRLYIADIADFGSGAGLTILDVSDIQQRKPNPQPKRVSHISWPEVSIPQTAIPVTIGGHAYLVEVDEFSRQVNPDPKAPVGAARVIDIGDDTKPRVVSNLRLAVNMPANRTGDQQKDPGAGTLGGLAAGAMGYEAHYCAVPARQEPGIVACSFIASGMRVFDIRDPFHPKELAYANFPVTTQRGPTPPSFAMSAPAFVPERGEIWYSDGFSGLYVTHVLNGVWPFRAGAAAAAAAKSQPTSVLGETRTRPAPSAAPSAAPAQLAVTGGPAWGGGAVVILALGLGLRRLRARTS